MDLVPGEIGEFIDHGLLAFCFMPDRIIANDARNPTGSPQELQGPL